MSVHGCKRPLACWSCLALVIRNYKDLELLPRIAEFISCWLCARALKRADSGRGQNFLSLFSTHHLIGTYRSVPGKHPLPGKHPGACFGCMNGERPLLGKRLGSCKKQLSCLAKLASKLRSRVHCDHVAIEHHDVELASIATLVQLAISNRLEKKY